MKSAAKLVSAAALALGAACAGSETDCAAPGTICTVIGNGEPAFNGDGLDRLETAIYWPVDLEIAPTGEPYVLDWQNHRVRRVRPDGKVETIIGTDFVGDGPADLSDLTPAGAPGTKVELNHPTDIGFLPNGTLVLAAWHNHKIRTWDPATGRVRVICGKGAGSAGDAGPAGSALLTQPKSIALAADGAVYVTDSRSQRIRKLAAASPEATIETVAGTGRNAFEGDGGDPKAAAFAMQEVNENPEPGGSIALDAGGRLYLADTYNHRIRRIDLATGLVETIAGNGHAGYGGDGGPATAASLWNPRDVEIAPDGRLFIADTDNHRIRVVDLGTGVISTAAGAGVAGYGGDGGPALQARFDRPFGVAFDARGDLYVADTRNSRIRKVVLK